MKIYDLVEDLKDLMHEFGEDTDVFFRNEEDQLIRAFRVTPVRGENSERVIVIE